MAELKTFLFTDICRSVDLKNEMIGRSVTERDQAFIKTILTPHRERIVNRLEQYGGRVVSTAGDGHFLVFPNTVDAAQWAIDVQQSHRDSPIATPQGDQVTVRISVHVGVPQVDPADPDNFVGKTVDYASRLNDYASGGQILVSRSVMAILDDVGLDGIQLHLHGRRPLKGIGRVEVHELIYEDSDPRPMRVRPTEHHSDREWTVIPATEFYAGSGTDPIDSATAESMILGGPLKRVGNYQLEELIGCGGMGDVYKARHIQFGRTRAVKVIKPQFVATGHQEIIRRFYHEIKAIGALEHKHIVVAIDSSAPADRIHYLVMEYIHGVGLHELIQQHGPLDIPDACEIVRQAAHGLQYIHGHNMVHRDIKPSNLMLTLVEGDDLSSSQQNDQAMDRSARAELGQNKLGQNKLGLIKILDLGLALLATEGEERLTRLENRAMGTGMYMSPEQWKTSSVDIRADIYSLGCTLYHLLAGTPPFYHSDLKPEIAHEKSKLPTIQAPAQIPRTLWDILRKMLAKNAQDRYQTPAEVAAALAPLALEHQLARLAHAYGEAGLERLGPISTRPQTSTRVNTPSRHTSWTSSLVSAEFTRRMWLWLGGFALLAGLLAAGHWWRTRVTPTVALIRDEITSLPGLNGEWWFHETPWFTPVIRKQLLDAINLGQRQFGDISIDDLGQLQRTDQVSRLFEKIKQIAEQLQPQLSKPQQQIHRSLDKAILSLGSSYREPYEVYLQETLQQLAKLPIKTPAYLHLTAVLHHALAQWKEAEDAYQIALLSDTDDTANPLRALMLHDYARMQLDSKNYDQAIQHFHEVRDLSDSPMLIMVSLCLEAEATYRGSKDPGLTLPLKLMKRANTNSPLGPNHPLRAYLLERQGWILNEAWRFNDAIVSFTGSKQIISHQIELASGANPIIPVLNIWVRQGEATAVNFREGPIPASQLYEQLVKEIDQTLKHGDTPEPFRHLNRQQRQKFRERLPSIYLRLGDCSLRPTRTANKLQEADEIGDTWDQASRWYRRCIDECIDLNWENTDRRARWVIDWRYKQCLPAILSGELAHAQQLYQQTEQRESELLGTGTLLPSHEKTFAFSKKLTKSLILLAQTDANGDTSQAGSIDLPDEPKGAEQQEGLEMLFAEVLQLKTFQLGRHKLGNYLLAVEQLAPRLVKDPERLRKLASHFHDHFVMYSKTGTQPELLPYLQPTIYTLHSALKQAMGEDLTPETRSSLEDQLKNLEQMIDLSLQKVSPQQPIQ